MAGTSSRAHHDTRVGRRARRIYLQGATLHAEASNAAMPVTPPAAEDALVRSGIPAISSSLSRVPWWDLSGACQCQTTDLLGTTPWREQSDCRDGVELPSATACQSPSTTRSREPVEHLEGRSPYLEPHDVAIPPKNTSPSLIGRGLRHRGCRVGLGRSLVLHEE